MLLACALLITTSKLSLLRTPVVSLESMFLLPKMCRHGPAPSLSFDCIPKMQNSKFTSAQSLAKISLFVKTVARDEAPTGCSNTNLLSALVCIKPNKTANAKCFGFIHRRGVQNHQCGDATNNHAFRSSCIFIASFRVLCFTRPKVLLRHLSTLNQH